MVGRNFLTLPVGNALIGTADWAQGVHLSATRTEGGRTASHASDRERLWWQVDVGRAGIVAAVHRRSHADQRGRSTHFDGGHSDVTGKVLELSAN